MELFGYVLFIIIGIVLGLIGSGGSILGVPVLVYVMGYNAVEATGYSLFIVGVASLIGSVTYFNKGLVYLKASLFFALPSLITIFWVRNYFVPHLPSVIIENSLITLTKNRLIMLVFAVLMTFSAFSMLKGNKGENEKETQSRSGEVIHLTIIPMIISGVIIGFLSGFVGAGGGFLIIPALVFYIKLPIKLAIGTSLTIISINSVIGFMGNLGTLEINWSFLFLVSALSVAGIFVGTYLSNFVSANRLKPAFGWFTLVVGIFVLIKEIFMK